MGKFKNWLADQKERCEMRAMERFNLREANRMGGENCLCRGIEKV